jgi:hypothetical protein
MAAKAHIYKDSATTHCGKRAGSSTHIQAYFFKEKFLMWEKDKRCKVCENKVESELKQEGILKQEAIERGLEFYDYKLVEGTLYGHGINHNGNYFPVYFGGVWAYIEDGTLVIPNSIMNRDSSLT